MLPTLTTTSEAAIDDEQGASHALIVVAPKNSSQLPTEDLLQALRSQLEEIGVSVRASEGALPESPANETEDGTRVLAFVWLVEHDGVLTVHFYEAAGASLRERRIPVTAGDAVSLEEVAIVVRSSVNALLERAAREASGSEDRKPVVVEERTPAQVPEPRSHDLLGSLLSVGMGLCASRYANPTKFQAGMSGSLAAGPPSSFWKIGAGYSYLPREFVETPEVDLSLARHPIEIFARGDSLTRSTPFFVGGQVGLVIDPVTRRTLSTEAGEASPPTTRVHWAVSPQARTGIRVSQNLSLLFMGGAEALLRSSDFVLEGDEPRVLVRPYRIRPRVYAGISLDLP